VRHWKQGIWSTAPKAYELVSHELACIDQVVLRGTRTPWFPETEEKSVRFSP